MKRTEEEKHPQLECKYPILLSKNSIGAIRLNHCFLAISSINFIIFVFIGEERLTTRQIYPRHTRPWDFGWNIAWSPSVHPNPYVWRFPKDSIASISTGASFRFNKWEKVSNFAGVEALLVTGKCNLISILLVGQM